MPPWFRNYLKGLQPNNAMELWEWFDGDPLAVERTISVVAEKLIKEAVTAGKVVREAKTTNSHIRGNTSR